jgi:hypothetical protein
MRFYCPANRLLKKSQKSGIVEMKCSSCEIRVVDAGPPSAQNRQVYEKLLKKVVLRKLKEMQIETQRKAS